MPHSSPPVVMTIAGSDCSSGAGMQADLKTFTAHGVYGVTVPTCVVVEIPGRVFDLHPIPKKIVCEQMHTLLRAFPVAAIKTGLLHTGEIIEAVGEVCGEHPNIPVVVDPVMIAGGGDALLRMEAVELYGECIFPFATLVTPNLDEARVLLRGLSIDSPAAMKAAGAELCGRYNTAFLMKGGHLRGDEAIDLLCLPDGKTHEYRSLFMRGVMTHGTGCTYSAAIAAGLATGLNLPAAVAQAKRYVTAAIAQSFRWDREGRSVEALNPWHFQSYHDA